MATATKGQHESMRNGLAKKGADTLFDAGPASNTYDPEAEYPEVSLGLGLTAQLMWITPEIAAEWLVKNARVQRNKKKRHLASIRDDIIAGRFRLNGETVVIDRDGFMVDGQHRMAAVVDTGIPIQTVVIRNVDPDCFGTLGNTAKRTGSDALMCSGHVNTTTLASAAVLVRRYERRLLPGMDRAEKIVLSPTATEQCVLEHPGLVASITASTRAGRYCGAPGVMAFCHYILSGVAAEDASDFFDKIATGEDLRKGDPILTFRNRVHGRRTEEGRIGQELLIHFVFKAWNYWRKGKTLVALRRVDHEVLPVPV